MRCPKCSVPIVGGLASCPSCGDDLRRTATTPGVEALGGPVVRDVEFAPGASFAQRYTIVERTGQGGMGVVYKAIDTSLNHTVALKLIKSRLAMIPSFVQRFKTEVKLTRQVTHHSVCRVHDIGESNGIYFLSMEWIEGETLRQLLNQAGMLDPTRAIEIGESICLALDAAHAKGIVHCDLKPENVMIDDLGAVFVMDFGLAVGAHSDPQAGGGTPAYMAPEQERGESVDARTDLFALGLTLLEMITGRIPAPDQTTAHSYPAAVPPRLAALIESLLAPERGQRPQSAASVLQTLREVRESTALSPATRAGGLPAHAARFRFWTVLTLLVFAAAITAYVVSHRLHSGLAAVPSRPLSPGQVFYEKGLEYVREQPEDLRGLDDAINMFHRAIDTESSYAQPWAGLGAAYWLRFHVKHEEIAKQKALDSIQKAFQLEPDLPEAHWAQGLGELIGANFKQAEAELEKAVRGRPDMDLAWVRLAAVRREFQQYAPGLEAMKNAIRLCPKSSTHQVSLGRFYEAFGLYDGAAAAYLQATELNPSNRSAWNNLGATFLRIGRPDRAVEAFQHSLAIEENASARSNLGTAYFHQHKYEQALENHRRAAEMETRLEIKPTHWGNIGDSLQRLGRDAEALTAYKEAVRLARPWVEDHPAEAGAHESLGLYCAKAKEPDCAFAEANRALALQPDKMDTLFSMSIINSVLGRQSEALDWLEKAVNIGTSKAEIENEPGLDPLHDNPRYKSILGLAS